MALYFHELCDLATFCLIIHHLIERFLFFSRALLSRLMPYDAFDVMLSQRVMVLRY